MELSTELNLVLFILRLVIGLTIFAHGWNKFFGGGVFQEQGDGLKVLELEKAE